jgi:uncharacterized protein DUF1570
MSERRRGAARRRPAPKKNNTPLILAGVVGLVAVVALSLVFMGGDDEADQGDQGPKDSGQNQAEAASGSATEKTEDPSDGGGSIFSAEGSGAQNESAGADEPERVVGRKPKTINTENLEFHKGALYLDEETAKAIDDLVREVNRYESERWDVTKEMKELAKKLEDEARDAKRDPFLGEANRNLKQLNNSFRKTELHKERADGSLAPEPFVGYVDAPYAVYVQADGSGDAREVAKEAVDLMQKLKAAFENFFNPFIDLSAMKAEKTKAAGKRAIKIVFLRTHGEYRTYNRLRSPDKDMPNALAHYEPNEGRLVVPLTYGRGSDPEEAAQQYREVLLHEGTHQLMDYYTGTNHLNNFGPMWSDEGLAEYFAGHHMNEDGSIEFGRMNSRIASLEGQAAMRFRVPLIEMVKFSRYTQRKLRQEKKIAESGRLTNAVYANGWALVYFLNNFEGGKYKKAFEFIMKEQMTDGDAGIPVLRKAFGDKFDTFSREFDAYQTWLGVVRSKGTIKDGVIPDPSP